MYIGVWQEWKLAKFMNQVKQVMPKVAPENTTEYLEQVIKVK